MTLGWGGVVGGCVVGVGDVDVVTGVSGVAVSS